MSFANAPARWLRLGWLVFCCCLALAGDQGPQPENAVPSVLPFSRAYRWEDAIRAFEELDKEKPPAKDGILFVGSSSFTKWGEDLVEAMRPLPVLNRGFGGSTLRDVLRYFPRVVVAYRPRVIVLYEGDNDLWGKRSAASYLADVRDFVARVREALPETRVLILSIKPSPYRWKCWAKMKEANAQVADLCKKEKGLEYVDVATPMLDEDGYVRRELFLLDRLHLNEDGYALWTSVIRPRLEALWKETRKEPRQEPRAPGQK
jgi:lysophospholipase L1-like esterase